MKRLVIAGLLLAAVAAFGQVSRTQYPPSTSTSLRSGGGGPKADEYIEPSVGICAECVAWWSMEENDGAATMSDWATSRTYPLTNGIPARIDTDTAYGVSGKGVRDTIGTNSLQLASNDALQTDANFTLVYWQTPATVNAKPLAALGNYPSGYNVFYTRLESTGQSFVVSDASYNSVTGSLPATSYGTSGIQVLTLLRWNQSQKIFRLQRRIRDIFTGDTTPTWESTELYVATGLYQGSAPPDTRTLFVQPQTASYFDEAAWFNRDLTGEEIERIWNGAKGISCPSGTGYSWPAALPPMDQYDDAQILYTFDDATNPGLNSGLAGATYDMNLSYYKTNAGARMYRESSVTQREESPYGRALLFDYASEDSQGRGVGTQVLPLKTTLPPVTLSFWTKMASDGNARFNFGGGPANLNAGGALLDISATYASAYFATGVGQGCLLGALHGASLGDGNWHNVVFTWEDDATPCTLYIDGVERLVSGPWAQSGSPLYNGFFTIGVGQDMQWNGSTGGHYGSRAQMDNVAMWQRRLSVSDILELAGPQ